MKLLDDARLYHDTAHCLAFARGLAPRRAPPSGARLPFHFYWYGTFSRKAVFALKSFLATQDAARSEAWLWLDRAGTAPGVKDEFGAALGDAVRIRSYDPAAEADGTPLAIAPALLAPAEPAARSDAFRLLALHRYGGVYVDMDTMFLRDFGALLNFCGSSPFCYRWSARQSHGTNAIMHAQRASPLCMRLLHRCVEIGSCHPRRLLRHDDQATADLLELPCAFFDSLWPHYDREDRYSGAPFGKFRDFFRPFGLLHRRKPHIRGMADFFPGAFAYQWHGLWNMPEREDSYFGMFEREVNARLGSSGTL